MFDKTTRDFSSPPDFILKDKISLLFLSVILVFSAKATNLKKGIDNRDKIIYIKCVMGYKVYQRFHANIS